MENIKRSFIVYSDWAEYFEDLTSAELGEVFKALFRYAEDGTEPEFSGAMRPIFRMMKNCLLRDSEKWEERCRRNTENGRKGGRPKKQQPDNAPENPAKPKKADSDSESDSVSVSDSESVSEKPSPARAYGSYRNIMLSDEEYSTLCDRYSKQTADKAVEEISEYCASQGKTYMNYSAAISRWLKRDCPRSRPICSGGSPSYDLDKWLDEALRAELPAC